MANKKNVIILTGGLAGSSVLTSLLARKGYWVGNDTVKKHDYDTWENNRLVELNKKLIAYSGFDKDWSMEFESNFVDLVSSGLSDIQDIDFSGFVSRCNKHRPWVWKDPRLWLTIRYWRQFLELSDVVFLVIKRDPTQAWISTTIRKQIQTYAHAKRYNSGIHGSILRFLQAENATYVDILYEDLILKPQVVLTEINLITGASLTLDDLATVFKGPLFKKQHGAKNFIKAMAIYLKNFSERRQ